MTNRIRGGMRRQLNVTGRVTRDKAADDRGLDALNARLAQGQAKPHQTSFRQSLRQPPGHLAVPVQKKKKKLRAAAGRSLLGC